MKAEKNQRFLLNILWILCAAVFAVLAGTLPAAAAENDAEMTFVLVTDVSSTMSRSDTKGYSKDAIAMFLDMLPAKRTAAGILSFGHNNSKNAYPYPENFLPTTPEHPAFVHRISAPVDLSEGRQELKNLVKDLVWNGEQTVIEAGLLAGCSELSGSGAGANAGCVILLTDGDYKSRYITDVKHVEQDLDRAVECLNENGWYVYCIELDYASNQANRASAHAFLTEKITDRCNGETYQVEDAKDVGAAFLEILNNLYGRGSMETGTANADGYLSRELKIGSLTSETDITVIGNGILGLELLRDGETAATVGSFATDADETYYDNNRFDVALGKIYCNIKCLLPEQGDWTVRVRAGAEEQIVTNAVSYSELVVETAILPEDTAPEKPLTKKDSIRAVLSIRYQGQNIGRESLGDAKASVHLTNKTTGEELSRRPMEWEETASAFTAEIPVSELGRAGQLEAACELRFGDGEVIEGKKVQIYTYNEPLKLKDGSEIRLEGNVRTDLAPVDISGRYVNTDGDAVQTAVLMGNEESDVSAELSEDGKELLIHTGNRAGDFDGALLLFDADMGESGALRIPLHVTVPNRPMEMKQIRKLDMTAEHALEYTLDLKEYFQDEDRPEIFFRLEEGYDPAVIDPQIDGSILNIKALADGVTDLTVLAVDDDGTEYRNTFTVGGATEESIRKRKIREFWEKTSALAVVLAVLAFAALLGILFVKANTKLRGIWKIVISAPGKKEYSYELNTATDVAKKDRKKAVLRRVLDLGELPEEQPSVAKLLEHTDALNFVTLTGVFREEGCKISAKPKVKMLVNGEECVTAKLGSRDEAMIMIPGEDGETAVNIRITV